MQQAPPSNPPSFRLSHGLLHYALLFFFYLAKINQHFLTLSLFLKLNSEFIKWKKKPVMLFQVGSIFFFHSGLLMSSISFSFLLLFLLLILNLVSLLHSYFSPLRLSLLFHILLLNCMSPRSVLKSALLLLSPSDRPTTRGAAATARLSAAAHTTRVRSTKYLLSIVLQTG